MAAKRIGIMDIRQIIQLKIDGFSNRKISGLTGIHRNSVNGYVQLINACDRSLGELLVLPDAELSSLFSSPGTVDKKRYEVLCGYFEHFRTELKKPGCTKQVLWEGYQQKHPGGYAFTQFSEHFKRWLKQVKASGKLDHKAGDKIYVDYTGKKLFYIDKATGEVIEVEVFVAILPCSGYTFVEAAPSQKLAGFIGSMNNCLRYFGGVPKAIVPDNLRSAVTKGSKYEPVLNKTFKDFALHYGSVINPTRTYSPQDKALVEGAVKIVYQRIFYPLSKMSFFSIEDLNKQIGVLLGAYNDRLLGHLNVSRRQQFLTIEQPFLKPLPKEDYEVRQYRRATVQKMGYVYLSPDKNYYSVPYRYIGKRAEVSFDRQSVAIHYKSERIALHKRNYRPGTYTTIKEHLSSTHRFYRSWSPGYFEKLATPHGEQVATYIKALIAGKTYPEVAYKQCLGILSLSRKFGKQRLNNACKRGLLFHRQGFHIIERILINKMDTAEQTPEDTPDQIEAHRNIRGASYYQ